VKQRQVFLQHIAAKSFSKSRQTVWMWFAPPCVLAYSMT